MLTCALCVCVCGVCVSAPVRPDNRARVMPQAPNIIASKSPSGTVCLFDSDSPKHASGDAVCRPEARLSGHTEEGYGLSWSLHQRGMLLSGADDERVCLWDVSRAPGPDGFIAPLRICKGHVGTVEVGAGACLWWVGACVWWVAARPRAVRRRFPCTPLPLPCAGCLGCCAARRPRQVCSARSLASCEWSACRADPLLALFPQDVAWHPHQPDVFGSVGDDKRLCLYVAPRSVLTTRGCG
jgi:hypothetical protein